MTTPAGESPASQKSSKWLGYDPGLLRGRSGRWQWYWILLGHAMAGALMIALLFAGISIDDWMSELSGRAIGADGELLFKANQPETYLSVLVGAVAFALPVPIVIWLVHRQDWRTVLGPTGRFGWGDFAKTAIATLLVFSLFIAIEMMMHPGRVHVRDHGLSHLPWVVLAALVTLPQAFSEDILFKGYLLRAWGAVLPIRVVVAPAIAALFTSLHAMNPDVKTDLPFMMVSFLLSDIMLIAIYLRTGSLAAVTGLHWMNNVLAICVLTRVPGYTNELALTEYRDTVIISGRSHMTNLESWVSVILGLVLLWLLLTRSWSPFSLQVKHDSEPVREIQTG